MNSVGSGLSYVERLEIEFWRSYEHFELSKNDLSIFSRAFEGLTRKKSFFDALNQLMLPSLDASFIMIKLFTIDKTNSKLN